MKRSTNRILTTHTGSLPRPPELLDLLAAKQAHKEGAAQAFSGRLPEAVSEIVKAQTDAGVDVVSDGEMGKVSFYHYITDRLSGVEDVEGQVEGGGLDIYADFPGFTQWQAKRFARQGGGSWTTPVCNGPLAWENKGLLEADINNFKQALKGAQVEEAFMPAISVGMIANYIPNRYYPTDEAYIEAIAGVMKDEYEAIANAGLVLQVDSPEITADYARVEFRDWTMADFRKRMQLFVEAMNYTLSEIPEDQIRVHVCWGNVEGPHTSDVPLKEIVDLVLQIKAGAYSVEAANPRHGHEWRMWEDVKLPAGKIIIPGVIDCLTSYVEHPELVADRIVNYANVVGRENVIAGTDCGFGTMAYGSGIYPPIVWAKLEAMAEGARIASKRLWKS
jgi:5-methyltetrahydropteroyltriglutamate--homocysteine methyltransferase